MFQEYLHLLQIIFNEHCLLSHLCDFIFKLLVSITPIFILDFGLGVQIKILNV